MIRAMDKRAPPVPLLLRTGRCDLIEGVVRWRPEQRNSSSSIRDDARVCAGAGNACRAAPECHGPGELATRGFDGLCRASVTVPSDRHHHGLCRNSRAARTDRTASAGVRVLPRVLRPLICRAATHSPVPRMKAGVPTERRRRCFSVAELSDARSSRPEWSREWPTAGRPLRLALYAVWPRPRHETRSSAVANSDARGSKTGWPLPCAPVPKSAGP